MIQIIALMPAQTEEVEPAPSDADAPLLLVSDTEPTLAPGIPRDFPPDYTVEKFGYVSVHNGQRQWKLDAERAFLFNTKKLVHARRVVTYLFDSGTKPTVISGREAKYFLNERDLEVYGDVETEFPDGFRTKSAYLRYLPRERKIIIPTQYRVLGEGRPLDADAKSSPTDIEFESDGLVFEFESNEVLLPKNVSVFATQGKEKTLVQSDQCKIFRKNNRAHFLMDESRPAQERFVRIKQPTLFVRSRTADLNYGSASVGVKYITAYDDVFIKQLGLRAANGASLPGEVQKYATSGQADFDNAKNIIILTRFPQVYQDNDTVTGDVIVVHRDTDIVEVEQSNAFSTGSALLDD